MKYISGAKLLERKIILVYILKAGAPVAMPEILRLRGIPVVKKSKLSSEDKLHYTSIATSTRHLMARLCREGLVSVDREQFSFWSLRFTLTPEGRKVAEECREFFDYINSLQELIAHTLETRSQDIHNLAPLPGEKVPGGVTRQPPSKASNQVKSEPKTPAASPKAIRPPPKTPPRPLPTAPKTPAKPPPKPSPKATTLGAVVPKIAPHPPVIVPPMPRSKMLRCPTCQTEFPLASVKRQIDRHESFECDCGTDLTKKALALIDALTVGA